MDILKLRSILWRWRWVVVSVLAAASVFLIRADEVDEARASGAEWRGQPGPSAGHR